MKALSTSNTTWSFSREANYNHESIHFGSSAVCVMTLAGELAGDFCKAMVLPKA